MWLRSLVKIAFRAAWKILFACNCSRKQRRLLKRCQCRTISRCTRSNFQSKKHPKLSVNAKDGTERAPLFDFQLSNGGFVGWRQQQARSYYFWIDARKEKSPAANLQGSQSVNIYERNRSFPQKQTPNTRRKCCMLHLSWHALWIVTNSGVIFCSLDRLPLRVLLTMSNLNVDSINH